MPGVGVGTAAVFLAETLGKTFDTGAQLASYAGLTPVTRRSGSSIRGERVCRTGNKRLKHAMFLSAFASLRDPVSRTYYQRKRDQDKRGRDYLQSAPWLVIYPGLAIFGVVVVFNILGDATRKYLNPECY